MVLGGGRRDGGSLVGKQLGRRSPGSWSGGKRHDGGSLGSNDTHGGGSVDDPVGGSGTSGDLGAGCRLARRLGEKEAVQEEVVPPRSRGVRCRGLSTSSTRAPPQSDRSSASVDVASTPAGKRRRRWSRSPSRRTGCERSRRRSKISSWNSATSCHLSRRPDCPACQEEEIA